MTTKALALGVLACALCACSRDQPSERATPDAPETAREPPAAPSPAPPSPAPFPPDPPDVTSGADPALPAPAASRPTAPTAPGGNSAAAVVIARLVDTKNPPAACGVLHVIWVMDYDVVRVERGTVASRRIRVAHGCPEMPRSMYRSGSGTLQRFEVGALHRLVLDQSYPTDVTIYDADYWSAQVDPAS